MVSLRSMSDIFSASSAPCQANHGVAPGCGAGAEIGPDAIFPAAQGCLSIAVSNYRISGTSAANSLISGKC